MIRTSRRNRVLAVGLAGLAGFVDALGFSVLGGFFVSFMSGNSTRLAVGLAGAPAAAATAAGLIGAFLVGVIVGSAAGHVAATWRRPAVLALVAVLLALGAGLTAGGLTAIGIGFVAAAMGAENAVFERDGEVSIGVTYMTGTLVKLGQRLAAAFFGYGPPRAWLPYLLLWLGLVGGAVIGALAYVGIGLGALWVAAGAAALIGLASAWIRD